MNSTQSPTQALSYKNKIDPPYQFQQPTWMRAPEHIDLSQFLYYDDSS